VDADRRRYRRALAATTFDGQVYLFAAGNGADDVVYSNHAKPGEAFMGWEPVGGTTDAPIAATAFDDHLYIFRKGQSDHGISYNVAAPGQPFTGWSPTLGTTAQAITATTFKGALYLIARGDASDEQFYINSKQPGMPFLGWRLLGGSSSFVTAAASFNDFLYLFAPGGDPSYLYFDLSSDGVSFTGWSDFYLSDGSYGEILGPGVSNNGAIAAAASASRIFLIGRGSNNHVYYTLAPPGEAFAPWQEIPRGQALQGPMITDAAPAATIANGLLYVVVKSPSQGIWIATADGF